MIEQIDARLLSGSRALNRKASDLSASQTTGWASAGRPKAACNVTDDSTAAFSPSRICPGGNKVESDAGGAGWWPHCTQNRAASRFTALQWGQIFTSPPQVRQVETRPRSITISCGCGLLV